MMHSVEDMKGRALAESNILKQFILSSAANVRGEFTPRLDDLLIHDCQMANSVTMNTILSNYMVDLAYAFSHINGASSTGVRDSYFRLVRQSMGDGDTQPLPDQTRLVLNVDGDDGTFQTRDLSLDISEVWSGSGMDVRGFRNLDSIWYCTVRVGVGDAAHDTLEPVDGMNDFNRYPSPFGVDNPFSLGLYAPPAHEGDAPSAMGVTFNEWLGGEGRGDLNCIIENRFYRNTMHDQSSHGEGGFGRTVSRCRYLICVPDGFFGLESHWGEDGAFCGFVLHDIGGALPILGASFEYMFCSFHVIGDSDEMTLILTLRESSASANPGKYHYLYLNESSMDETYGFTEIDSVVVDQMIVPPSDVFSKVEQIMELDTVNIAMTDYGFWDVESNTTNSVTYSYRSSKDYIPDAGSFNGDVSKLVTPTIPYECGEVEEGGMRPQIAVEYSSAPSEGYVPGGFDRIWELDGTRQWYVCRGLIDNPNADDEMYIYRRYRSSIVVGGEDELPFVGGTDSFAVYGPCGDQPIHILADLTQEQFIKMLYSSPNLTQTFTNWLYGQVVAREENGHPGKGEYYLWNKIGQFSDALNSMTQSIGFDGLEFQLGRNYGSDSINLDVSTKFRSIAQLVESQSPGASTLTQFCTALNGAVGGRHGVNWLVDSIGGADAMRACMKRLFMDVTWPNEKHATYANETLDGLVDGFGMLEHMRAYLSHRISVDTQACLSGEATMGDGDTAQVVSSVQEYIRSRVPTSLVLGGYSEHDGDGDPLDGNARYPGIDQYILQNQRRLNTLQVKDVMSMTESLKEATFGVQSAKFFNSLNSFNELQAHCEDSDLFTMTQNSAFVALSNLVTHDDVATLDVDWGMVKEWLFGGTPPNCSDGQMLKAFIRTQIYRPMFFKGDSYVGFSGNEGNYRCTTTKWYVDHNGVERQIVFLNWPTDQRVDKVASGLSDTDAYDIPEGEIAYFNVSNKFEYAINHHPVQIVGDRFVMDDVEFYTVRPDGEGNPVNSIYFNEFSGVSNGRARVADVTDGAFSIDGVQYAIEGSEISVDGATSSFHGQEKEWKCEIVDGMFCMDGTWYALETGQNGEYTCVRYADGRDTHLVEIYVTTDGYAEYSPWNIQFQFDVEHGWNSVQAIEKHQSDVKDRVESEWCAYDTSPIQFDSDRTFDWYVANAILDIIDAFGGKETALARLGNGILYDGRLRISGQDGCVVRMRNEVQNEDVVTMCELSMGDGTPAQTMGILFDRDLNLDPNRAFRGDISGNLATANPNGGRCAIFVKDIGGGMGNINVTWTDYANWTGSHRIETGVGQSNVNPSTGEISIQWGTSDYVEQSSVKLSPVREDGGTQIVKYSVSVGSGASQYTVWVNGDSVNFVVDGNRYRMNLLTNSVDRLVVQDVEVSTVDFRGIYTPSGLRDGLVQNIQSAILNLIVQAAIDSVASNRRSVAISLERLGCYLDMFPDTFQTGNYAHAWELDAESPQCVKFSQIFKNSLRDIDDSSMANGNMHSHLQCNIDETFTIHAPDGDRRTSSIMVVDAPSIEARREGGVDVFTYSAVMDVHLAQNMEWMRDNATDGSYVVSNAVVKGMSCHVELTPKYDPSDGSMSYDARYTVDVRNPNDPSGRYGVEYGQIVYSLDGKTRQRTVSPVGRVDVDFTGAQLELSYTETDIEWIDDATGCPNMVNELLSRRIDAIFTRAAHSTMLSCINNQLPSGQDVAVDGRTLDNPGCEGSIWPLGEDYHSLVPVGGEVVSVDRGWTYIRGQTYQVSDGDTQLLPLTGSLTYGIGSIPIHQRGNATVIGVLHQPDGSAWRFQYLKSFNPTTWELTFTDSPSDAKTFPYRDGGRSIDAIQWIEDYMDNAGGPLTRDSFGVFPYAVPMDDTTRYVATSSNAIVRRTDIDSMFAVETLATDSGTQVFLSYRGDEHLPSRFHVKGTHGFDIPTGDIVNLGHYERSIRKVATDAANAQNLVYSPSSNGFYEVGGWLTSTHMRGRIVEGYNGYQVMPIGPGLEAAGRFSIQLDASESQASSVSGKAFHFGPSIPVSYGEWDGTIGLEGEFTVDFTGLDTDSPMATVVGVQRTCHALKGLPDARVGKDVEDISEYTPIEGESVEVTVDIDSDSALKTLSFSPMMRITPKTFALNHGSGYIASNGMYVNCGASGDLPSQYVIALTDFNGNPVGDLPYGCASVPMDIDDAADKAHYESILHDGQTIDDVPHRTIDEYEWSAPAFFALGGSGASRSLAGDGLDYPASLDVLPAGGIAGDDGQIFNRVFQVQTKVYASPMEMDIALHPMGEGDSWIDAAGMVASIGAPSNVDAWKRLIHTPTGEVDECVPERMREGVRGLVDGCVHLDNAYFTSILSQLETFLSMVGGELWNGLDGDSTEDISRICTFPYSMRGVSFKAYSGETSDWGDPDKCLFGYRDSTERDLYEDGVASLNIHLADTFKTDWGRITPIVQDHGADSISTRDYFNVLNDAYIPDSSGGSAAKIDSRRTDMLLILHSEINMPPSDSPDIESVFGEAAQSNQVRFINAISTTVRGELRGLFVADGTCRIFTAAAAQWYEFDAERPNVDSIIESKIASGGGAYAFSPSMRFTQYPISGDGWVFKMLNRDFTGTSGISDAFAVHCVDDSVGSLWYVPHMEAYIYGAPSTGGILDMAYEQYGDRLYVLFNGDSHMYAYDGVAQTKTFRGFAILQKETATLKLVTFNSMSISDSPFAYDSLFLDYFPAVSGETRSNWNIALYGMQSMDGGGVRHNIERWRYRPGWNRDDYQMYNSIMFGDSLFDTGQLRFHNISKNKDMYDILDVNEIDGRYYGLFKNENEGAQIGGRDTYTVFKVESSGGVVQRLPWQILEPHMYRTNDSLYSLYVVSNEPGEGEEYHPVLREITVPDSIEYPERVIDICELYRKDGKAVDGTVEGGLRVITLMMDGFKTRSTEGGFFALTNMGFHRIFYRERMEQLSIDALDGRDVADGRPLGFRDRLWDTFQGTVLTRHMDEMHNEEQSHYFQTLKGKVNQFSSGFSVFSLIPTEFKETQDVGVIPDSPLTDVDEVDDHRDVSILASTDILWTDGMVAQTDTNPGIVTAAVSNPATIYDDDSVFTKSQRNPSIEGTEFYDFIYDQDGNTLMDLYAVPFIYRINSNNTYDLYINIPTTRTKYLNRLAGTLKDNGTTQVLPNDTRTRLNFMGEMLPNSLDESTTRLRVFIDRKYVSIGTVDLVEISGNSIPIQIYRDTPNDGLYDSIALESRWNGEVVQIDEPSKDINKVMLEFECYGTDSQSIHVRGRTLVNRSLDGDAYGGSSSAASTQSRRIAITLNPMGGEVSESTVNAVVGEMIGDLPIPTWESHVFDGWYTGEGGALPDGIHVRGDTFVTADMETLYAHWKDGEGD